MLPQRRLSRHQDRAPRTSALSRALAQAASSDRARARFPRARPGSALACRGRCEWPTRLVRPGYWAGTRARAAWCGVCRGDARVNDRSAAPARVDHQDRLRTGPTTAARSGLALLPTAEDRPGAGRSPSRPATEAIVVAWSSATTAASHLDTPRAARQTPPIIAVPPPANSPASPGRSPRPSEQQPTTVKARRLGRRRPGPARGTATRL
jgi:hypothetical protein